MSVGITNVLQQTRLRFHTEVLASLYVLPPSSGTPEIGFLGRPENYFGSGRSGLVRVTDALTLRSGTDLAEDTPAARGEMVRLVNVLEGPVRLRIAVEPRGGATAERRGGGIRLRCASRPELDLQLWATVPLEGPRTTLDLDAGDQLSVVLRWGGGHYRHRSTSPDKLLDATLDVWRRWARRIAYEGPQEAMVRRSAITLKDEEGVDPERATETFAQITLFVDNWRWSGVPFVLRSGKALTQDRSQISLHFKSVPHLTFGQETEPAPNILRLLLNPDRIVLDANINGPGDPFGLEHTELRAELAPQELPSYGRLLLDVLEGDPTLSIRGDEAEESWRIVEPILEAWEKGNIPLLEYSAGSEGPTIQEVLR